MQGFLFSAVLVVVAKAADTVGSTGCTASVCRLDNGNFRFGSAANTNNGSFTSAAIPNQPFYFDNTANAWYKLTFSQNAMDAAIGFGQGITSTWTTGNIYDLSNLAGTTATLDYSGFTVLTTDGTTSTGYGSITASRPIDFSATQKVLFETNITMGRNDPWVTVVNSITNTGTVPLDNVYMWVGTGDDYVGDSPSGDSSRKQRGYFNGETFVVATSVGQAGSNAVVASTDKSKVIIFSDTPGALAIFGDCCQFANFYNKDPSTVPADTNNAMDGGYVVLLNVGNVAVNEKKSIRWYYGASLDANFTNTINSIYATSRVSSVISASNTPTPSAAPASSSPTLSPTKTTFATRSPSKTVSPSRSPSRTASSSATPVAANLSPDPTPSVSASITSTMAASGSVSPSGSIAASSSPSFSPSPTGSESLTASSSASVTASSSIHPSETESPSVSLSVTPTLDSPSVSPSITASGTDSASVTASVSASGSTTASVSGSTTVSPSSSISASVTPSRSIFPTGTGTATGTRTALASFSSTPSRVAEVIIAPKVELVLTLVGGDGDTLRAGSGIELRRALADLSGVATASGGSVVFTSLTTSTTTYPATVLTGLANSTFNSTAAQAISVNQGTKQVVPPNDPMLNAPVSRRLELSGRWMQQQQQGGCNPVTITTNSTGGPSTVVVPTTVAGLEITFPPSYYTGVNMQDATAVHTATKVLTERLMEILKNVSTTETAFSSFTQSWSSCTGLPPTTGVITNVASAATITTVAPSAPPDETPGTPLWPIIVGIIVAVIIGSIVFAFAMGCHVTSCCWWCYGAAARRRTRPEEEEMKHPREPYEYSYPLPPKQETQQQPQEPASPRATRVAWEERRQDDASQPVVSVMPAALSPVACRIDATGFQRTMKTEQL
jgi:hypothetical protein